jgi:hypothetical protein
MEHAGCGWKLGCIYFGNDGIGDKIRNIPYSCGIGNELAELYCTYFVGAVVM